MTQRSGITPWHMWGNTQTIQTIVELVPGPFRQGTSGQLVKISYKRPETWHWLLSAKLIAGPTNTPAQFSTVFVSFDLVVGIGRSTIQMVSGPGQFDRSFERFDFIWGPTNPGFPVGKQIWGGQVTTPNREFTNESVTADARTMDQIVAEDLQLNCRVTAVTALANVGALGQPVTVEVSAQFTPKTHIRPEWHTKSFPGAEDGGGVSVAQQVQQLNYPGTPLRRT